MQPCKLKPAHVMRRMDMRDGGSEVQRLLAALAIGGIISSVFLTFGGLARAVSLVASRTRAIGPTEGLAHV